MAIIGVIASVVVLLYFLFVWGFWGLMILPKYNIGVSRIVGALVFCGFWPVWFSSHFGICG